MLARAALASPGRSAARPSPSQRQARMHTLKGELLLSCGGPAPRWWAFSERTHSAARVGARLCMDGRAACALTAWLTFPVLHSSSLRASSRPRLPVPPDYPQSLLAAVRNVHVLASDSPTLRVVQLWDEVRLAQLATGLSRHSACARCSRPLASLSPSICYESCPSLPDMITYSNHAQHWGARQCPAQRCI